MFSDGVMSLVLPASASLLTLSTGGLVDREDAREGPHRVRHPRRHGPEHARRHHARVPLGILPRAHHHRPARTRNRRAAGPRARVCVCVMTAFCSGFVLLLPNAWASPQGEGFRSSERAPLNTEVCSYFISHCDQCSTMAFRTCLYFVCGSTFDLLCRCLWSSTMTCPPSLRTTCTVLVALAALAARAWPSTSSARTTRGCSRTSSASTTPWLRSCRPILPISSKGEKSPT